MGATPQNGMTRICENFKKRTDKLDASLLVLWMCKSRAKYHRFTEVATNPLKMRPTPLLSIFGFRSFLAPTLLLENTSSNLLFLATNS